MRKNTDLVSFVLAGLTLALLGTASVLLVYDCRQNSFELSAHPGVVVLMGIIPVLLIQILILFHRKRERGGSIVFADLDDKDIPEDIFEVPEQTVLRFCRDEFHMDYRIEYWPSLRSRLLADKQKNSPDAQIAERLLRDGAGIVDGDHLAYLEYTDKQGKQAMLSDLNSMPTAVDGAMEIIRNNFLKTWVFHNPGELAMWELELPEAKRPLFRTEMLKFLRRRAKDVN